MKSYKLYFENGNVIELAADHTSYLHDPNLNTNVYVLYDSNDNIIGRFNMSKMLGDVVLIYDDESNEKKESMPIGFQAPKETPEPETKKKPSPKKKKEK